MSLFSFLRNGAKDSNAAKNVGKDSSEMEQSVNLSQDALSTDNALFGGLAVRGDDNDSSTHSKASSFSFLNASTSANDIESNEAKSAFSFMSSPSNAPEELSQPRNTRDLPAFSLLSNEVQKPQPFNRDVEGANVRLTRVASTKAGVKKKKRSSRVGFAREDGDQDNDDNSEDSHTEKVLQAVVLDAKDLQCIREEDEEMVGLHEDNHQLPASNIPQQQLKLEHIKHVRYAEMSSASTTFESDIAAERAPSDAGGDTALRDSTLSVNDDSLTKSRYQEEIDTVMVPFLQLSIEKSYEITQSCSSQSEERNSVEENLGANQNDLTERSDPFAGYLTETTVSHPLDGILDLHASSDGDAYAAIVADYEKTQVQQYKLESDATTQFLLESLEGLFRFQVNCINNRRKLLVDIDAERARLAAIKTSLAGCEAEQASLAQLEEFDKADALTPVIESARSDLATGLDNMKIMQSRMNDLEHKFHDQTLSYAGLIKTSGLKLSTTVESLLEEIDKVRKETKLRCESEEARLRIEEERLQMERSHARREEKALDKDAKVTEDAIQCQSSEFSAKKLDIQQILESVQCEIAELERTLAVKRAHEGRLLKDLHGIDSRINDVKKKFDRQLQRIQDRRSALAVTEAECEQEQSALSAEMLAFLNELDMHRKSSVAVGLFARTKLIDVEVVGQLVQKLSLDLDPTQPRNHVMSLLSSLSSSSTVVKSDLQEQVDLSYTNLSGLQSRKREMEAQQELITAELRKLSEAIPRLEQDKKAHAGAKRFKEAAATAKELKDLATKKESLDEDLLALSAQLMEQETNMIGAEESFAEAQEKLKLVQKESDTKRFTELMLRADFLYEKIGAIVRRKRAKELVLVPSTVEAAYSAGVVISSECELLNQILLILQNELNAIIFESLSIKKAHDLEHEINLELIKSLEDADVMHTLQLLCSEFNDSGSEELERTIHSQIDETDFFIPSIKETGDFVISCQSEELRRVTKEGDKPETVDIQAIEENIVYAELSGDIGITSPDEECIDRVDSKGVILLIECPEDVFDVIDTATEIIESGEVSGGNHVEAVDERQGEKCHFLKLEAKGLVANIGDLNVKLEVATEAEDYDTAATIFDDLSKLTADLDKLLHTLGCTQEEVEAYNEENRDS